jgi:hypothetical protein
MILTSEQRRTVWIRLWDMWADSVATGQTEARQRFLKSTRRNLDKTLNRAQFVLVNEILEGAQ